MCVFSFASRWELCDLWDLWVKWIGASALSPFRGVAVSSSHFFSVVSSTHSALQPNGNFGRSTTSPASVMPHLGNWQ
jgi:hypothetical protein